LWPPHVGVRGGRLRGFLLPAKTAIGAIEFHGAAGSEAAVAFGIYKSVKNKEHRQHEKSKTVLMKLLFPVELMK
jgi:hypothetical protein